MQIINMTQHTGTETQHDAGLIEWVAARRLTADWLVAHAGDAADFETVVPDDLGPVLNINAFADTPVSLASKAQALAEWASAMGARAVMIGGHFGLSLIHI